MNNIKAFPKTGVYDPEYSSDGWRDQPADGMDLRDYFAAKAMQGFCSHNNTGEWRIMAEISYLIADTMLKEREKQK